MIFREKNNGFAIIYVMLIITMTLTVSMGVASLVYRERSLARIARDSLQARAAADVGMECVLLGDKMPTRFDSVQNPVPLTCGRDSMGNATNYIANLTSLTANDYTYTIDILAPVDGPCFKSYLYRDILNNTTKIDVFGYNICDIANPSRVERGIIAEY